MQWVEMQSAKRRQSAYKHRRASFHRINDHRGHSYVVIARKTLKKQILIGGEQALSDQ